MTAGTPLLITWVNEALLEALQVGASDLIGRELASLKGPTTPDATDWTRVVAAQANSPASRWEPAVVNRRDGKQLLVHLQVTAIQDAGWVVQLQQVSDAEQTRNEASHPFRAVFGCTPDDIAASDAGFGSGSSTTTIA